LVPLSLLGETFGLVLLLGLVQVAQLAEEPELVFAAGLAPFSVPEVQLGCAVLQQ
jgi:hypothetical protein